MKSKFVIYFCVLNVIFVSSLKAATQDQTAVNSKKSSTLITEEVVVSADRDLAATLPDVKGAKIYSGKKTSVIDLDSAPVIANNNYRQALQKTPGLLVSEETTPLISIGYHGLPPGRAQYTQVLKDGIPIHADMFGYPEAYYTPALQTINDIEFVHGGATLLYGPQPGGALNYVTKDPKKEKPLSIEEENIGGSHGFYSNYTEVSGTEGDTGYLGYFHHRQSQGFRQNNSQVDLSSGGAKLTLNPGLEFTLDAYKEEHGEPGGLTRTDFDNDPTITKRLNDRFELTRYASTLSYEREVDPETFLESKIFGASYKRFSTRQRTSGTVFGGAPNGSNSTSTDIEDQRFYTGGMDTRIRKQYSAFGLEENNLTMGMLYYHTTSPRKDKRGATADAEDGTIRKDADRYLNAVSLFAENQFKFDKLSLTPGIRLENIWQRVKEHENLDKTSSPLIDDAQYDFVPLLGLGAAYELAETTQIYANLSQGYRPKVFTQAVPTGNGQIVNEDLEEGKSWQTDVGIRGNPVSYLSWDASAFYMQFNDQIGTVGTTGAVIQNVGDARHFGVELASEIDLIGWLDNVRNTEWQAGFGSLKVFNNLTLINAKFVKGPNKNLTPQYAPDYIFKTGLEYESLSKNQIRLAGTFLDDHFGNDTNTAQLSVPSYKIWDLTSQFNVYRESVFVTAGINNLFDEQYFARVSSNGIDPADGRNYYGGLKMIW